MTGITGTQAVESYREELARQAVAHRERGRRLERLADEQTEPEARFDLLYGASLCHERALELEEIERRLQSEAAA